MSWQHVLLMAAVIVAVSTIGKAAHWVYDRIVEFAKFSERVELSLDYVEAEMRTNGGSTMRDAVDRIDKATIATRSLFDEHVTESAADRADLRQRLDKVTQPKETPPS